MFSWLRRRDAKIYPDDRIGDALYKRFPSPRQIPETVILWLDAYFPSEADAARLEQHLQNRGVTEIERDYDSDLEPEAGQADDPETGFPWNVDFELDVVSQHRVLKQEFENLERAIQDCGGRVGSWLVLPPDE